MTITTNLDGVAITRADEFHNLLAAVEPLLSDFISSADTLSKSANTPKQVPATYSPEKVIKLLDFDLPGDGQGQDGITSVLGRILECSVNTWGQGFMSKLYAEPTSVGAISELILGVLNTNLHVFKVSPALTVIEKHVAKALAAQFGFTGVNAGGLTQPGGSASNLTALVVARNSLFPEIKEEGYGGKKLVLFTSAHGHYSFEKAAQICGLGSKAARSVAVDAQGRIIISELEEEIRKAREEGFTPFFVNATAGTTVLGSYDPMTEMAEVCKREGLWFHVDASWGGGVVFSRTHRNKLSGCELADSLAFNPHKMLNVPVTCSFLLAKDLKQFWRSNTLPANYLFHAPDESAASDSSNGEVETKLPWDLADMALQCGRKGDALKLALSWIYYGTAGFEHRVDNAFVTAAYLATLVQQQPALQLVSENPTPCLQVCFFYGTSDTTPEENTKATREISKQLLQEDFHIDFAAGDKGSFLRVVVNLSTQRATVEILVRRVVEIGKTLV